MMAGGDILTWLGVILSAIGAIISVWQAYDAKKAAQQVIVLRDQISKRRSQGELGGLDVDLENAFRTMDKYGPGATQDTLYGTSPADDAAKVRVFTAGLDRHEAVLAIALGKDTCAPIRDRLNNLLKDFADALSEADRMDKGREIYQELAVFRGSIKRALDAGALG